MVEAGQRVRVHYRGTLDDGTIFADTMRDGEPAEFTVGSHEMLAAVEIAVGELTPGESCNLHIPAERAYGAYDKNLIVTIPRASVPEAAQLKVNEFFFVKVGKQTAAVKLIEKNETSLVVDCNHELAGKDINYYLELIEVLHESAIEHEHHASCGCGCDVLKQQLTA